MNRSDIIKVIAGVIIFFGTILLYINEFKFVVNTEQSGRLILYSAIVMSIFAGTIIALNMRHTTTLFEKFMLITGVLLMCLLLTPLFGSLTNRLFGTNNTDYKRYDLISISARSEQPLGLIDSNSIQVDGFRILVETEHGDESFYVRERRSFRKQDDTILLPMRRGGWGFDYLYEMK